ncbi:MAG TPA: hypothetical protein VM492_04575 [Sumerlaeia bacterium]|nr:hypothetical protein [Sumerlaeia bacterium]
MTEIPKLTNQKWLRIYHKTTAWAFWFLLVYFAYEVITYAYLMHTKVKHMTPGGYLPYLLHEFWECTFPGVVALIVSQFVFLMLAEDKRPGYLLRIGGWILYFAAILKLVDMVIWLIRASEYCGSPYLGPMGFFAMVISIVPKLIAYIVVIAALVGLGYILNRLIRIVEESKTLA